MWSHFKQARRSVHLQNWPFFAILTEKRDVSKGVDSLNLQKEIFSLEKKAKKSRKIKI